MTIPSWPPSWTAWPLPCWSDYQKVRQLAARQLSALLVVGCVTAVVIMFPSAFDLVPLLLLSVAFTLVAGGNTLFGLFTSHTARVLGEMTYSIYLLHGLVLFLVFHFGLGFADAAALTAMAHWGDDCTVNARCYRAVVSGVSLY